MALAVRLRVIDAGVVVHVLSTSQHLQPVQDQVAPGATQHGGEVMAREAGSEDDGARLEGAVPALMGVGGRDMISVRALALHPVVLAAGAVAQDELRHGVREGSRAAEPGVRLDHGRARLTPQHDEIPRMPHRMAGDGGRDEQQLQRCLDDGLRRHRNERAIGEERGRKRCEPVGVEAGVLAEVRLDQRWLRR